MDGFGRIEESDMYLVPDLKTFQSNSWNPKESGVAHIICDVHGPDGKPFEGCPRVILKKALKEADEMGFTLNVGPEGEFFYSKEITMVSLFSVPMTKPAILIFLQLIWVKKPAAI